MTDTWSSEGPQCPHCGRQFTADDPFYYDEQCYTEQECDECGSVFDVSVEVTVAWACSERVEE